MKCIRGVRALIVMLSLVNFVIHTATLFVTNLLDDGGVGSLRQTVATAVSGDTVEFLVAGTIFLDPALGALVVDKTVIINGGGGK